MAILYRHAGLQDVHNIAILFDQYRQFYNQGSDLSSCENFIEQRLYNGESYIITAWDGDKIVGFGQIYPSFSSVGMKKIFVFNDFYVLSEYRSKGVDAGILNFVKDFAIKHNVKTIVLETSSENTGAQALYEKFGFKKSDGFFQYIYNDRA